MADFITGNAYLRASVLSQLRVPDFGGGSWYTGLIQWDDEFFSFRNVGVGGRTGHDYDNYFDGAELEWTGRTGSSLQQPSITQLVSSTRVHIFFRDDNRQPFIYAGIARAAQTRDVSPVQVRWSFSEDVGAHPELSPTEIPTDRGVFEGACRTVSVNVYERDPSARARCLRRWGTACKACGFDFEAVYGELG